MGKMIEWLKREGAVISPIQVGVDPRGQLQLIAAEDLWKGKLVVSLPETVMLRSDKKPVAVSGSQHLALEHILHDMPDGRWDLILAAKLLALKSEGSFHSPYLKTLPDRVLLPSFFSPNSIAETQSEEIYRQICEENVVIGNIVTRVKQTLQNYPSVSHTFRSNFQSFHNLLWAQAVAKSRSLGFYGHNCLAPLIDLANHNFDPNVVTVELPNGRTGLMACKDVLRGEPLELCYTQDVSHEFFWNYGFIPKENENDELVVGPFKSENITEIVESYGKCSVEDDVMIMAGDTRSGETSFVSMAQAKRDCLSRLGLDGDSNSDENQISLRIDSKGRVEGLLLASLRVLLAQTSINELKKLKKQALFSWRTPPPLGIHNEIQMVRVLIEFFLDSCDEVGLLNDRKMLQREDLADDVRLAIEYRMVNKSIMSRGLTFLRTKLDELEAKRDGREFPSRTLRLDAPRIKLYANKVKRTKQ